MSEHARTFVAVEISLPAELRTILRQFREMGRAVKAADSAAMHITLKFLGDTPMEELAKIAKAVESALGNCEAFELESKGIGAFPHWGRPQVVWAGVVPEEPLVQIADALENTLEPLGFPKERRAYHPHLTLARIKAKPPAELKQIADAHETQSFGTQIIDTAIYYQSELEPTGAVYTPLSTIRFEGGADADKS